MGNVVHLHGDMHPSRYVRTGKLTEAEIDALIRENRTHYDAACEAGTLRVSPLARRPKATPQPAQRPRSRPSRIPLDHSLLARLSRWLSAAILRLRSPI